MNTYKGYSKIWFLALLLVTFVAGCAGNDTVAPNSPAITAYSINNVPGTINETAKTIEVTLPNGINDVTALVATFTTSKATSAKVGPTPQISGETPNDFTNTVEYNLNATVTYKVTVTKSTTITVLPGVVNPGSATNPTVISSNPSNSDKNILTGNKLVTATFSEAMNPATIISLVATFKLNDNTLRSDVPGTVTMNAANTIATFTPTAATLNSSTSYTATITTEAKNGAGVALLNTVAWSFTTAAAAKGPLPVNLGTAGNFVILAKTGVSTTGTTTVVGDIGVSPDPATSITGFDLIADSTNTFSTSALVMPGKIYASNYTPPTPTYMTTAVSDMETAFTDAAGRKLPDFTELYSGDISGRTLVPGLYKWGTGVLITGVGVTLSGGANDVWIFQIAQDLTVNNSAIINLIGGAQAKNIFWQVSGQATLGTAADFKGIILSQTLISLKTGAKMNGRALAQSAVTLEATAITAP